MPTEKAIFGAGCFWGVEARFAALPSVLDTAAGYAGGDASNPSYDQVCTGNTGHAEVVEIIYNPEKITYAQLLDVFFSMHNPAQPYLRTGKPGESGKFSKRSRDQYRSMILTTTPGQASEAHTRIAALEASGKYPDGIVTEVAPAPTFWRAETHHQQYFAKRNIQPE